jgi:hypothetical protein
MAIRLSLRKVDCQKAPVRSEDVAVVAAEVHEVLKLENEAHGDIVINARKNYNNEMLAEGCSRKANRMEVHTPSGDTLSARARLEISHARQVHKALPTRNSHLLLGRASCGPGHGAER